MTNECGADSAALKLLPHPEFVEPLHIDVNERRRYFIDLGDIAFAARFEWQFNAVRQECNVVGLINFATDRNDIVSIGCWPNFHHRLSIRRAPRTTVKHAPLSSTARSE